MQRMATIPLVEDANVNEFSMALRTIKNYWFNMALLLNSEHAGVA